MAKREIDDPARASRSEMNMTPMIDVTFQLIIVFLCSQGLSQDLVVAALPARGARC